MHDFETMISRLASRFLDGDLATVTDHFDVPLAIYVAGKVIVCATRCELVEVMAQYHRMLLARGAHSVEVRVVAAPVCEAGSGEIRVEKTYYDRAGAPTDDCRLRYYVRQTPAGLRICLVQYDKAPLAGMRHKLCAYRAA